MAMVRTFIAVDCGKRLQTACGQAIDELLEVVDGVRWVHPENLHLTLKFLGEVEDRELNSVCRQVAVAANSCSPFAVTCQSLGAFPSVDRPNTIWIGVQDDNDLLQTLQKNLETSLFELGFPVERRPFKPHLTLGRTKSRRFQKPEWQRTVERYENHVYGELSVQELVVYSSELERRGPLYTALARCPLA